MKVCFYFNLILLIFLLSCSSYNYNELTNEFLEDRDIVNPADINLKKVPDGNIVLIGRVVYYIDSKKEINNINSVELGFLPLENIINIEKRINNTKFYKIEIDKNGYFFIQMDKIKSCLSYIYLELYNQIYPIPPGAIINVKKESELVYCGEIHIIKREKLISNKYYIDTFFQFYNNMFNALEYLQNEYSIDSTKIDIIPFFIPFQNKKNILN